MSKNETEVFTNEMATKIGKLETAVDIGDLICKEVVCMPQTGFKQVMHTLIEVWETQNPEMLAYGLFRAVFKMRRDINSLFKILTISDFPWRGMHGQILFRCLDTDSDNAVLRTRLRVADYVIQNTHIPITKKWFDYILEKHDTTLEYTERTAHMIARYRPELLDYTAVNSDMEIATSITLDLLGLLSCMPQYSLSEKAITNLIGEDTSLKPELYAILARNIPLVRSPTLVDLLLTKLSVANLLEYAMRIMHISDDEKDKLRDKHELRLLLGKNSVDIVNKLIENHYVRWDVESAYNAVLILASKKDAGHFERYTKTKKLCENAKRRGVVLDHRHMQEFSAGLPIIKGVMDKPDGGWDKKLEKLQKIPFISLPVGVARPQDTLREYITKDIQAVLNTNFPNFEAVTKMLVSQLLMKHSARQTLQFRPMLLLGDAGIGKTTYIQAVCELIGLVYQRLDMASFTGSFALIGAHSGWHDAAPGLIARAFFAEHKIDHYAIPVGVANPVFILDEVDKIGSPTDRYPVAPTLLAMLEPETAKDFKDEYLEGVTLDLTYSTFFMTANTLSTLSDPFLSRVLVVDVPAPTYEEKRAIAHRVYTKRISDLGLQDKFSESLDSTIVDVMCKESLRTLKRDMFLAVDNALWRSTDSAPIQVMLSDIQENTGKNKVGFSA